MPAEFQKPESKKSKEAPPTDESRQQPVWHVLVLNMFTGLAYSLFWSYRVWSQLSKHAQEKFETAENISGTDFALSRFKDISPLLRVIGAVVYGVQVYIFYKFFEGLANLYPNEGSAIHKNPQMAAGILTFALTACVMLGGLGGAWFLLFLLGSIPLAIAQFWLNAYWRTQEEGKIVRQAFNIPELVALVLGASLYGLVVVGFSLHLKY